AASAGSHARRNPPGWNCIVDLVVLIVWIRPFRDTPPAGRADYRLRRTDDRTAESAGATAHGPMRRGSCSTANQSRAVYLASSNQAVSAEKTGILRAAVLRCGRHDTRASGDGMKRTGDVRRAARLMSLPVCVCFPEACAKLISGKTACQTFLTTGK
ncbi:hypothetical protein, partial [Burkholderia vietnamiensis]|uniref:hypothetical protein n=1 Tax=Burkholderia vietnamiensis TaxID=60552 RepID=UPI003F494043